MHLVPYIQSINQCVSSHDANTSALHAALSFSIDACRSNGRVDMLLISHIYQSSSAFDSSKYSKTLNVEACVFGV